MLRECSKLLLGTEETVRYFSLTISFLDKEFLQSLLAFHKFGIVKNARRERLWIFGCSDSIGCSSCEKAIRYGESPLMTCVQKCSLSS